MSSTTRSGDCRSGRRYDRWLDSPIADFNNVSSKPHAGAITAALFLQRFVAPGIAWAHLDLYAWNDQTSPGRPEGGEAYAHASAVRRPGGAGGVCGAGLNTLGNVSASDTNRAFVSEMELR